MCRDNPHCACNGEGRSSDKSTSSDEEKDLKSQVSSCSTAASPSNSGASAAASIASIKAPSDISSPPNRENVPAGESSFPPSNKVECRIGSRVYDITNFIKKHPGGRVIAYYANEDATEAFNAFHYRSARAQKMLRVLPSRPVTDPFEMSGAAPEKTRKLLESFRSLHKEMKDAGLFEPDYFHVAYRIVELFLFFGMSFWLMRLNTVWSTVLSIVVGGLAGGRCGWVQHEGGHGSLTGILSIDKGIQKAAIAFGLITYNWKWNHMHNKHHATPQREDYDLDVDTLPFVAFYRGALDRGRRIDLTPTWWIKWQHYTFIPLTTVINVIFWHLYLHPKEYLFNRRTRDFVTLGFVISRYVFHYYACPAEWSIVLRLVTFWSTMFLSGMYLFGNFSLNHTHLPTTLADDHRNWIEYGIDYTVNVDPDWRVNWWMGYLNCQIEHHLFPQMPQYRQPQITRRVREWCKENGLTYQSYPYWTAVKMTLGNLRDVAMYAEEKEKAQNKIKEL